MEWSDFFYSSIISVALLLSLLGVWFTAIMPVSDRWNRRFFLIYFIVFTLCCLFALLELFCEIYPVPGTTFYFVLVLECGFLALPILMNTVYLLHCSRERIWKSPLFSAGLILLGVYLALQISAFFIGGFTYFTPNNQFYRGPRYPLLLLPLIAILLINLVGVMQRRKQFSRKVLLSLLVTILPLLVALLVQLFMDVYPLIDISYVLSALSMYSLIQSDQIERHIRQQQEIVHQQQELAHQRASVMVLKMRPHFIYNTLMSIYGLCNQDPQKARQVILDFTNYLRKNFNAVSSDTPIPFSAELEHARAYLAVEKAQYEEMLLVDFDTPFTRFRLPPLTLQPIVENAIKHGMNPYEGPLRVSIQTRHTEDGSVITVEDNGPGFDPVEDSEPHLALTNIRERLLMMCDGKLEAAPRDGGGTTVTVTIPDSSAAPIYKAAE